MARIRMDQGQLDDSAQLLERIDASIKTDTDRALYGHRSAELTRTQLLIRQGHVREALRCADSVIHLATVTGDELLRTKGLLAKAELLQLISRPFDSLHTLSEVVPRLTIDSSDLYADYERILAVALASALEIGSGSIHYNRAKRIHESLSIAPGLLNLKRSWKQAVSYSRAHGTSILPQEIPNFRSINMSIVHSIGGYWFMSDGLN